MELSSCSVSDLVSPVLVPITGRHDMHAFMETFWNFKAWLYLSSTLSMTEDAILWFSTFAVIVLPL